MMEIKNIPIGKVLKECGYVTEEQIQQALAYQKEHRNQKLGNILISMGFVTERQMLTAMSQKLNLELIDINSMRLDVKVVQKIPRILAEKYQILAIKEEHNELTIATNNPINYYGFEDIRQSTGKEISIVLSESNPLKRAIDYYYSEAAAHEAAVLANEENEQSVEELMVDEGEDDATIIKLLRSLIERAYAVNASDIHIEPFEHQTLIRMRVNGAIVDYVTLQKSAHQPLIARIKILSNLDIAERRVPQDGHYRVRQDNDYLNIRVSLIPTVFGEKAVLRLLSNRTVVDNLHTFGMKEENYKKFEKMIQSPNGIIYITGPTGSGKSTTLYMVLEQLAKKQVNISTIENPVEKNVMRVNQMEVNTMAGVTFEAGLRALLRQDPDIIMVGETRDAETASISVRAAITGHLVFSTLHTNNAVSTIIRLKDMGLESYMLAGSLVGVVAQRLMRKVCPNCSELVPTTEEEREFIGKPIKMKRKAGACNFCNLTGYVGRVAIHEIVMIDSVIKSMIIDGRPLDEITKYAIEKQGMRTLREEAIELFEAGETTMEEVMKVAYFA